MTLTEVNRFGEFYQRHLRLLAAFTNMLELILVVKYNARRRRITSLSLRDLNLLDSQEIGSAMKYLTILIVLCLLCSGCSRTLSNVVHHSVKEAPEQKKEWKIAILPVDVAVKELTAGGIAEEVPDWSQQGASIVEKATRQIIETRKNIKIIPMPDLSEQEKKLVEQHTALYDLVAGNAFTFNSHPAWKAQREKEGYTLGKGLAFLKDRCEADNVLMVIGQDYISSGGRKTASFFAAALGVYVPLGYAVLHAGVVDLETGNVLWMNTSMSQSLTFKEEKDAQAMVNLVFEKYMEFEK